MGVTNFKYWSNRSKETVQVRNFERPGDTVTLPPGDDRQRDMWVPWCDEAGGFNAHHIEIAAGSKRHYVWQSKGAVRHTTDGSWSAHAPGVPGSSREDGERRVYIREDGSLYVDEA